MAYCNHCGAYIPDGQTVCVACGFDPEAESRRAAEAQAAAYAYREAAAQKEKEESDRRAEAERRRAERQQSDRAWAESERRRRQMEEEYQRAQAEKEKRAESYVHRDGGKRVSVDIGGRRYTFRAEDADAAGTTVRSAGAESENAETETHDETINLNRSVNKGLAAISYLGALVFVPLLLGQDDPFVKFHARQGLKLLVCSLIASAVGSFFGIGWAATLLGIGLAVKGVVNAVNGKQEKLPLLDKFKMFD